MKVQSYGAGVQSVALLYKCINGEYERPDVVIFADTMAEPKSVYDTVERDRKACEVAGIRFEVVCYDNLCSPKSGAMYIPAYTYNAITMNKGTLLRTCTDRFKIQPIRRILRKLGATSGEMWLGISTDEATRMKDSSVQWLRNRYPLIEMNMSRTDCEDYLRGVGVTASKSACVFCPYRSQKQWRALTESEMREAVEYDRQLRDKMKGVKMYVHTSRKPLDEAMNLNGTDLDLFQNECEGYCGL